MFKKCFLKNVLENVNVLKDLLKNDMVSPYHRYSSIVGGSDQRGFTVVTRRLLVIGSTHNLVAQGLL